MKSMRLFLFLVLPSLVACSSSSVVTRLVDTPPEYLAEPVNLASVPFFPQEAYQCGPAALATALVHEGVSVTVDQLVDEVYIPARQGSLQLEMLAATRRYAHIPYLIEPDLEQLLRQVSAGHPVLVFQNLGLSWLPQWHFAVVVGYDLEARTLMLRSGTIREYTISLALFEKTWRRAGNWAFVVLQPGEIPPGADPLAYLEAVLPVERLQDPSIAAASYRAAVDHWPDSPLFLAALGNHLYGQGDLAGARDEFRRLVGAHPLNADGHNNLAFVLFELGDLAEAEQHARTAVELGGQRATSYQDTLATILAASGTQTRR